MRASRYFLDPSYVYLYLRKPEIQVEGTFAL